MKNVNGLKCLKNLFYILMIAILGWFLCMQLFGANEQKQDLQSESVMYKGTFYWKKGNGQVQKISIPGQYGVSSGQTMVIYTTLPKSYNKTSFAIRSSLQDVKFYVGNSLRTSYSTKDTRWAGKNSASRYVFCPTSYKDAGKKLRIELTTYTSNYSGVVNQVYCGSESSIWQTIYSEYGGYTYMAVFILLMGITTILFSVALKFIYHANFDIEYFGWCMVMGAVWMLGESKLRQLLVFNASALASLCFVMIMLSPLPLLFYADSVQEGLHHNLYKWIGFGVFVNFGICSLLYLTKIKDYIETLPIGQLILLLVCLMVFIHLFQYLSKRKNRLDHFILFGFFLIMICVGIEVVSVYFVTSISGAFIGIGMMILLFMNILRTMRNIQDMQAKTQQRQLQKEKKQNEQITIQMMQTLASTIEDKDEYSRGHSKRVAEYASLIAEKLGWSFDEIENLKICAYLHDIGRIGVPDQILNKPDVLNESEFKLIQQHTLIGANILKDITFVPHLIEVTKNHHEHYDGTGYPEGLKGSNIDEYARVVAVADSFDAMNSRRIYRNPISLDEIRKELLNQAGRQFDPEIVKVFVALIDDGSVETVKTTFEDDLSIEKNTINKLLSGVITTLKDQEESKNYDLTTGLAMRNLGEQLIDSAMHKTDGCLAFLDMDNLKKINDIYGHKAGDKALQKLGKLLLEYKSDGIACRMGGDEFLLYLPNMNSKQASEIMTDIFSRFHELTQKEVDIHFAALSAGLCMCQKNDAFASCYNRADKALYEVKQNGKNSFVFYHEMNFETGQTGKDLKQIARSLQDSGCYTGALDLEYRDFSRQYEYIHQLVLRNDWNCYLVLVTMETKSDTVPYMEEIEKGLSQLKDVIHENIRKVDVCTRYSTMQYLIILFQPIETKIPEIMNRIFSEYEKKCEIRNLYPTYEYLKMTK